MLPEGFQPAPYIRAFSELMRIDDASPEDFEKFAAAHKIEKYIPWWIEREASNVAKIHDISKSYGHLIGQNLTLDGGLTDRGTVSKSSKEGNRQDITVMLTSVFNRSETLSSNAAENQKLFLEKYFEKRKNIGEEELGFLHSESLSKMDEYKRKAAGEKDGSKTRELLQTEALYREISQVTAKEFEKRSGK
ncbi:hypothetical protein H0N99_04745 [Candidatus Micrarchaeota archaeon]|nr:hypothetical protein [Candidatus Micrarchaeota archaeon]